MRARLLAPLLALACTPDYGLGALDLEPTTRPDPPQLRPEVVEDVLRQRIPPAIDVLWVIDNSNSMLAEQEALANTARDFLQTYVDSGLDWHIGVVSTDMDDPDQSGRLQGGAGFRWVDPSVPDPVSVFRDMAVLGRSGSMREQGRAAAYAALASPAAADANAGFYRADARLSLIFVSDEEDHSRDRPTLDAFVSWLLELKQTPELVSVAAVVQTRPVCESDGDTCVKVDGCTCGLNEQGTEYLDLVERTGGVAFDINADEWTPILRTLANLGAGLSRTFYLSRAPVPETIAVSVEDGGQTFPFEPEEVSYDPVANAITFETYTPRARAEVHVVYEVLGDTVVE